eukprot:795364-Prorocentrum_minimum.AAC.4
MTGVFPGVPRGNKTPRAHHRASSCAVFRLDKGEGLRIQTTGFPYSRLIRSHQEREQIEGVVGVDDASGPSSAANVEGRLLS